MTPIVLALCDRLYAASEALASAAARRGEDEFARRVTRYLESMATLRSEIMSKPCQFCGSPQDESQTHMTVWECGTCDHRYVPIDQSERCRVRQLETQLAAANAKIATLEKANENHAEDWALCGIDKESLLAESLTMRAEIRPLSVDQIVDASDKISKKLNVPDIVITNIIPLKS